MKRVRARGRAQQSVDQHGRPAPALTNVAAQCVGHLRLHVVERIHRAHARLDHIIVHDVVHRRQARLDEIAVHDVFDLVRVLLHERLGLLLDEAEYDAADHRHRRVHVLAQVQHHAHMRMR
ncbi:hypothetical protein [Caballeronia sp. INML2]|uniref:hypothetical protein n=1 Tax=Caballeronia sp. INML2 TaxID=2921748 RepID=UPI002027CA36|nr:hypothetical protein [Caballeronia sp. INML2]